MAKFCTNCGATLPDDKNFCTECGSPVATVEPAMETPPVQTAPPPVQQTPPPTQTTPPPVQPVYQYSTAPAGETIPSKGSKYDPITTGGYIGIMLLMCIPVVGLILMIVWAFGGAKKINKRNLARASLIMMAIGFVLSLIFGFVIKAVVNKAAEAIGLDKNITESIDNETAEEEDSLGALGALGALAALSGDGEDANVDQNITNSDIEELEALSDVLSSLEALTGESSENGEGTSLSELAGNAVDINRKAEEANDGWPKSLREYPGGTATAVASYRTEISDTTLEEMLAWIEDLKKDGYKFQDFYDFGFSEEDMLSMNGWWATDGEIYLSVSYYDGLVTIDHTKELPDLSNLF